LESATYPENADQKEVLLSEAVEQYTVALQESPKDVNAYVNRGVAFARLGQHDQAIADYNAALDIASTRLPDVIKNRGLSYEQQGEIREALADFETFLNLIADMPSERRADEREFFTARVKELRFMLSELEPQNLHSTRVAQRSAPDAWVWRDFFGNAKTHNDTYPYPGGHTTPNIPGFACEVWYPGHKIENAVWFQLPSSMNRSAYVYYYAWGPVSWDHYYASATGWTPLYPNNYYLQVPNTSTCAGWNPPSNHHKIHAQVWD
jgi:tetratricopeptide (TPR) repeat protein